MLVGQTSVSTSVHDHWSVNRLRHYSCAGYGVGLADVAVQPENKNPYMLIGQTSVRVLAFLSTLGYITSRTFSFLSLFSL